MGSNPYKYIENLELFRYSTDRTAQIVVLILADLMFNNS